MSSVRMNGSMNCNFVSGDEHRVAAELRCIATFLRKRLLVARSDQAQKADRFQSRIAGTDLLGPAAEDSHAGQRKLGLLRIGVVGAHQRARFAGRPSADMASLEHHRSDALAGKLIGGRESIDPCANDDCLGGDRKRGSAAIRMSYAFTSAPDSTVRTTIADEGNESMREQTANIE